MITLSERSRRWIAFGLHAVVLGLAAMIFAWPVARSAGVLGAAVGAALGALLADQAVHARFRVGVVALGGLVAAIGGAGLSSLVVGSETVASLLGAEAALTTEEVVLFGGLALGAALGLRALALRYRAALAIEGSVVVMAVAVTVAAHRDGMIARPLEISDWFWTQGVDPVVAFLALGVAAAVLLAGILAHGRSLGRTLVQLGLVLLLGIFLAATIHGRDPDAQRDVLGRSSKDKDQQDKDREKAQREAAERRGGSGGQGQAGGGQGQGNPNQDPYGEQNDMRRPPEGGSKNENRPTAVVIFHRGVTPGNGIFYFRHAAFSQWNGARLVMATQGQVDEDARAIIPFEKMAIPAAEPDAEGRELVATDVAWLQDHQRFFGLIDPVEAEPIANPDPARFRRAYRTVSSVLVGGYDDLIGGEPGDRAWSDDVWKLYTQLPKDPRYQKLASELRDDLRAEFQTDPMALAMAVKAYLESHATYTFDVNYEGAEDPTAAFLFSEDKRGYCVHLAHAAAFLMRGMGLPTRVSAGYAVPASNLGGGSSLLIKGNDAHAWAELYLAGRGWVPIEVIPEKTEVKPPEFAERDLQQLLGEMARKEGRAARDQSAPFPWLSTLRQILDTIPWALLGALVVAYGWKGWRLLAPLWSARRHRPRAAYRAALDRLSAVGVVRLPGESPERFAARVAGLVPSFAPLTHAHSGFALGSVRAQKLEDPVVPLSVEVGRELRKQVPWWRWLIGLLNPVSWIWSR